MTLQTGGGRTGVWAALEQHPPLSHRLCWLCQAAKGSGAGAKGLPQSGAAALQG